MDTLSNNCISKKSILHYNIMHNIEYSLFKFKTILAKKNYEDFYCHKRSTNPSSKAIRCKLVVCLFSNSPEMAKLIELKFPEKFPLVCR